MRRTAAPTGRERRYAPDEILISKTDTKGRITYANTVFIRVSGFTEAELIGQPHNLIRHPGMPRAVFRLLWERISAGQEIFAYVKNLSKDGDHYWVYAHVTPSLDGKGAITGYHSFRRFPKPEALARIEPLYASLIDEEARHADPREGLKASYDHLQTILASAGTDYDEFVITL